MTTKTKVKNYPVLKSTELVVFFTDTVGGLQMRLTDAAKTLSDDALIALSEDMQSMIGSANLSISYPEGL